MIGAEATLASIVWIGESSTGVISVTKLLLDTKMLECSLASSNVPLLLLLCFITVEFVDSLVALLSIRL